MRTPRQRRLRILKAACFYREHILVVLLVPILLYGRFKNESEFRDSFVKPLLNRLGFYGVSEQHGSQEFGKDFVFSELHRLGGMKHYAAQVKHEEKIVQGKAVDGLLSQVRQAFAKPFKRTDSPRECHVSGVYIFNSGEITTNAKEQLLSELAVERYGDNVHFLDGERLDIINERAALQNDTDVRARLLGLRYALRMIRYDLKEYRLQGVENPIPIFVHGIESYLSEPVQCDDELVTSLFRLWQFLQLIETVRTMSPPTSVKAKQFLPSIVTTAQEALPLAEHILERLDVMIAQLKPLE